MEAYTEEQIKELLEQAQVVLSLPNNSYALKEWIKASQCLILTYATAQSKVENLPLEQILQRIGWSHEMQSLPR